MKKALYIIAALVFTSCSTQEQVKEPESKTNTPPQDELEQTEVVDSIITTTEDTVELMGYIGEYFGVQYPKNFSASPAGPIVELEGLEYIETDEATFTSPDSTVIFYVYSPKMTGTPEDYVNKRENEIETDRNETKSQDGDLVTTIERASFEDKEGKYKRAFVSVRDAYVDGMETIRLFGIQYKDQASYDKYLPDYKEFKKSLKQFAD